MTEVVFDPSDLSTAGATCVPQEGSATGALARNGMFALMDQAVVSGTSFMTAVLVGRLAGPEQLGAFSLAISLLILAVNVQDALIFAPYSVYCHRLAPRALARYSGGMLVQMGVLAALWMAGIIAVALGLAFRTDSRLLTAAMAALALVIPGMLLREFSRRLSMARLAIAGALAVDVAIAVAQLGTLAWLGHRGPIGAAGALLVIGVVCGLLGAVWLVASRRQFALRGCTPMGEWRRNWPLGKWMFAARALQSVHGYSVYWFLVFLAGPKATGTFAASMTLLLVANPLILGVGNILLPEASRAFAQRGYAAMRSVIAKAALFLMASMVPLYLLVILFGDHLVHLFYGRQFNGDRYALIVLAAATLMTALTVAAHNGLCTAEKPLQIFGASLMGLLVTAALAPPMIHMEGVRGAAWAVLAGNTTLAVVSSLLFLRLGDKPAEQGGMA